MSGHEIRWAFNAFTWVPNKSQLLEALSFISREERERIFKFVFQDDYKLSLCGRILIRKCISRILKIPGTEVKLSRSTKGKPYLMNQNSQYPNFSFNVSHQGDFTVLAATTLGNVGVDIMKLVPPVNSTVSAFFHVMRKQFTKSEWMFINSFDQDSSKLAAFYRLWCLKESYVKATGDGIGVLSAEYLNFDIKTRLLRAEEVVRDSVLYVHNVQSPWQFEEFMLDPNHIVSVATNYKSMQSDSFEDNFFCRLSPDELLGDNSPLCTPEEHWWEEFSRKSVKCRPVDAK